MGERDASRARIAALRARPEEGVGSGPVVSEPADEDPAGPECVDPAADPVVPGCEAAEVDGGGRGGEGRGFTAW